jgi:hypothetical protein
MVHGRSKTPRYVLKDGSSPASPDVLPMSGVSEITVIFGFSDKQRYDAFQHASPLALMPYPLVKGYMQNQIAQDPEQLRLVALDANTPQQETVEAATFTDIVESFQLGLDSVPISYRLDYDPASKGYRVEAITKPEVSTEPLV